jgi:hypothetical protein
LAIFSIIAVMVALLLISPIRSWFRNHPHGDPDPGGKRLAELTTVALEALPFGATSTHLIVKKSTWGHGGCDGGPPGWTNMEADRTFRAAGDVVAEIDANMHRIHWSVVSQLNTTSVGPHPRPVIAGKPTATLGA